MKGKGGGVYQNRIETHKGRVYTSRYRIYGDMFVLPGVGVAEQLNRADRPYLPVGEPVIYEPGPQHPPEPEAQKTRADFIAVPRDTIWWLAGGNTGQSSITVYEWKHVAVLFGDYLLRGKLKVPGRIRVSDYLGARVKNKPFDILFDASINLMEGRAPVHQLRPSETFEFVTVNLANNTGICEIANLRSGLGAEG